MLSQILTNAIFHGSVFGSIFLILIAILGITGGFKKIRDDEGNFIRPLLPEAYIGFILFIGLIGAAIYWSNLKLDESVSLVYYWLNGFLTFVIMSLIDLIILDYLIVVLWHPELLNLPKTAYYTSMRPHFIGFFRGLIFGVFISGILAFIFWLK